MGVPFVPHVERPDIYVENVAKIVREADPKLEMDFRGGIKRRSGLPGLREVETSWT